MAVFAAMAALLAAQSAPAATPAKPNIVFIYADDLGYGDIGYTNQLARAVAELPAIATPNIDALAGSSLEFTQMYSGAPICSPSRASMLTGFQMQHVIKEHTDQFNGFRGGADDDKTWGQMLQDAGYDTGMWGKWHLGGVTSPGPNPETRIFDESMLPTQQGFETAFGSMRGGYRINVLWENDGQGSLEVSLVDPEPSWPGPGLAYRYSQDVTAEHAVNYIETHANGSDPFAMYVALEAPHVPLDRLGPGEYEPNDWPEVQERYANMVTNLDQHIGSIVARLEDPNDDGNTDDSVMENTLIVFASDNGALWTPNSEGFETEFFDSNGQYSGAKTQTLEGGIRTPFLVRWDGVTTPGSVNNDYVGSVADIYATFAELVGQDTPFGQDGQSMLPAILGQSQDEHSNALVFTAKDNFGGLNQGGFAVRLGDWKLVHHTYTDTDELYHIEVDPYETTNLAASRGDIVAALTQVAELEGVFEEPFFATGSLAQGRNVYFTQYKYWEPSNGNSFETAENWGGGTQFNRDGDPEALYWNTGPASNWLAKVDNNLDGFRNAWVTQDATVLAMEIVGTAGTMQVNVSSGVRLDAYNGVRIEDAGILRMLGGTVATVREVDVRDGGKLVGSGVITGHQDVLAGIAEFADRGFLEPEVVNGGQIEIYSGVDPGVAGLLEIAGDFTQTADGELAIDLFNAGGVAGSSFDRVDVHESAQLAGVLALQLMGGYMPVPGQQFVVLTAGTLLDDGLMLAGPDGGLFSHTVVGGTDLTLTFLGADFDSSGTVDGADLALWEENFGMANAAIDVDGSGLVDGGDFLIWQRQYGASGPSLATVPEPAAWSLLAVALSAAMWRGRSTRR